MLIQAPMRDINMTDKQLLNKFKKDVCKKSHRIDPDQLMDWTDLSIGWFLAQGCRQVWRHI